MSKNTGLGASLIFSGGRRRQWVAGISEWVPVGPTTLLGAPRGVVAPCGLVAHRCTPLGCVQCQKFLNILEKIILNFHGILRTFIFGPFFLLLGKFRKQDNHGILFYSTKNNREQKVGTEGCAY